MLAAAAATSNLQLQFNLRWLLHLPFCLEFRTLDFLVFFFKFFYDLIPPRFKVAKISILIFEIVTVWNLRQNGIYDLKAQTM